MRKGRGRKSTAGSAAAMAGAMAGAAAASAAAYAAYGYNVSKGSTFYSKTLSFDYKASNCSLLSNGFETIHPLFFV